MINDRIKELISKYNQGTASSEDKAILESWMLQYSLEERSVLSEDQRKKDLSQIRAHLVRISLNKKMSGSPYLIWFAAASIILLFSLALYFYNQPPRKSVAELAKNDISAGRDMATLTLADGRKILLNDETKTGELAEETGMSIVKNADGQITYKIDRHSAGIPSSDKNNYNTLSTARGQQYQVELPDGTKVWLNAASSITYSPSFLGQSERRVSLTGEAYFEVAKDKIHPFIVTTRKQEVRVLGTHFNIDSYDDEPGVKTTLIEGSVNINGKTILMPGQQSLYTNQGLLTVKNADVKLATAWTNGRFVFHKASIQSVMRQVSRWYDIDVVYPNAASDELFNGTIDRKASLSRILKILENGDVKFVIQGRKIFVNP